MLIVWGDLSYVPFDRPMSFLGASYVFSLLLQFLVYLPTSPYVGVCTRWKTGWGVKALWLFPPFFLADLLSLTNLYALYSALHIAFC
jgi:hypothetical protein